MSQHCFSLWSILDERETEIEVQKLELGKVAEIAN